MSLEESETLDVHNDAPRSLGLALLVGVSGKMGPVRSGRGWLVAEGGTLMPQAWEKRLSALIRKYQPSEEAAFRNDYRDVVDQATSNKDLLFQVRDCLEEWVRTPPPEPQVARQQWEGLYGVAKEHVPTSVLESLLRRFPATQPGTVNWNSFLLRCSDSTLIDVLYRRRLVQDQDLNELAQSNPGEFYRSVALDVLVARDGIQDEPRRLLWEECVGGNQRPSGLLSREQFLVYCFSKRPGDEGNEQLLSFLLRSSRGRSRVLQALLDNKAAALRLCRYMVFEHPIPRGWSKRESERGMQDILQSWLTTCEGELGKGRGIRSITAAFIVGLVRLSLLSRGKDSESDRSGKLSEETARVTQATLLDLLRQWEENISEDSESPFVVLRSEVCATVAQHLRRLPSRPSLGQDSPERALRFERHLGSKQVLEHVLAALEEPLGENTLRDALEVALFNCGVRPIGEVGEQVQFDAHSHEAEAHGVVLGDSVVITHPGRCLGEGDEQLVLIKAKIRPV
jgi:hypothetical protein